ncbi:carbonic anhydrase [Candidatus Glomeribacter gigasporarum]|nr:carbonic anhydrase [Candidatus Glomeribacter gigasporarum]
MLLKNQAWAREMVARDPDFFLRNINGQSPAALWIGCADSRVPAEYTISAQPGDLFVHRNIANLVSESDLNVMSIVQYALIELKIRHIIVCGHHGCGGVRASMAPEREELLYVNRKLKPLRELYRYHSDEIDPLKDEAIRVNRLVELNVLEQVRNLYRSSVVQRARQSAHPLLLHGWVYDIRNGRLSELVTIDASTDADALF